MVSFSGSSLNDKKQRTTLGGYLFTVLTVLAAWAVAYLPAAAEPAPSPFPQFFTNAPDGARIAYYTRDKSAETVPLIVISGGPGSDHRYMHAGGAFERLALARRVVMYDQRATGSAAPAPETPTIDMWVSDIEAVRKHLGAERIDLLGHSFGGYLAMSYAVAHPERARSLILVDSSQPDLENNVQLMNELFPDRANAWRSLRASLDEPFRAEEIALFFSMEFADPGWLDRYVAHVTGLIYDVDTNEGLRADIARRDLDSQIEAIMAPTLVIHGRFDAILATSTSWSLHQRLENSRFEVFERSGHMPFIEEADPFAQRVADFLRDIDLREQVRTAR